MFLFQLLITFLGLVFLVFPIFGKLTDDYSGYLDNLLSGAAMLLKMVVFIAIAMTLFWAANGVIEGLAP